MAGSLSLFGEDEKSRIPLTFAGGILSETSRSRTEVGK